jgi:biopolymer transport protein ExbD
MHKLDRFRSADQIHTKWPLVTGAFLMVLAVLFGVYWYRIPELCNPCVTLPKASTSVLLPDDAVVIWIHVDDVRANMCAVYTTENEGLGSSWDIEQVVPLARAAAKTYPDRPFIIKADVAAPSGLVHDALDAIRAEGVREVFFQSELKTNDP